MITGSQFQNRSSRREEAPYFLQFEPRYLGCYGVLKEARGYEYQNEIGVCHDPDSDYGCFLDRNKTVIVSSPIAFSKQGD